MSGVRFAGYAALFDRRDRGGDVIAQGAFADSLKQRTGDGQVIPILWQHDPGQQIGTIEHVAEDARGLRVIGRLWERGGAPATAAALLRKGAVDGLSFGYRVVAARPGAGSARRLERLDIVEVSLVTHPMQPGARVHALEAGGESRSGTPGP